MGSQHSAPLLAPHAHFPHALSSRYTRARPVTLRLEPCFWSHTHPEPLEIRDVTTNLTMFRIPTSPVRKGDTHAKRLLDMYNSPVATASTHARSATTSTTTITPASHLKLPSHHTTCSSVCTIETTLLDNKSYVSVQATWGSHATITCEGDWAGPHNMDFWLETASDERPHHSHHHSRPKCTRIARIHSDPIDTEISGSVLLEIAPGVDVALLLLICAAIDDAVSSQLHHTRRHKGATAKRRSSRLEIAMPSMRRSDAVPVPV